MVGLLLTIAACGGSGPSATTVAGLGFPVETPQDGGAAHLSPAEVDAILLGEADPPEYSSIPATSGIHAPVSAPCGIYREEIPEMFVVHTLEHGAVVVYYQPAQVDEATLAEVEGVARTMATHIVVAPFSNMLTPVALVAWGHLAARPSLEVEEVRSFWGEYAQRGPESGVSCAFEIDQA